MINFNLMHDVSNILTVGRIKFKFKFKNNYLISSEKDNIWIYHDIGRIFEFVNHGELEV
jgi:hypothetical protein